MNKICVVRCPQLDRNANTVDVKVVAKVDYQFQAVAREDKGPIAGIDWNKSALTDFKTSAHNKEVPRIPDPPPHTSVPTGDLFNKHFHDYDK